MALSSIQLTLRCSQVEGHSSRSVICRDGRNSAHGVAYLFITGMVPVKLIPREVPVVHCRSEVKGQKITDVLYCR